MARVTVEDCVDKIPNRFDLVLLASQRARAIAAGAPMTLERDNDKNPVVALREVADETITPEELSEAAIYSLRKHVEADEPEEDDMSLLMAASSQSGSEDAAEPAAVTESPAKTRAFAEEMKDISSGATNDTNSEVGTDGMTANFFGEEAVSSEPAAVEGDTPSSEESDQN